MHELSVAQSIIDYVLAEAERNNAKSVSEISVEVGELTQVDADALRELLRALMTGPKLADCKVRLLVKEADFRCNRCGSVWDMREARRQLEKTSDSLLVREPDSKELPLHFLPSLYASFLHCPKCGSADIAARSGEDIRLRKLVME